MSFLFRWNRIGGALGPHVEVRVFAGPDPGHRAMTGSLVMRHEEWAQLHNALSQTTVADVSFEERLST